MKKDIQILWFKKNLRVSDNQILSQFDPEIPIVGVYFFEPSILQLVDTGKHQMQFTLDCLGELKKDLNKLNIELIFRSGETVDALEKLSEQYNIIKIFGSEETGNVATFERDIQVLSYCKNQNIQLIEFPTNGVVRRLKTRDIWSQIWNDRIHDSQIFEAKISGGNNSIFENLKIKSDSVYKKYRKIYSGNTTLQKGGEKYAAKILDDFLKNRSASYSYNIGKPGLSRLSCSRLSPYIAVGNISIKAIYQATISFQNKLKLQGDIQSKKHSKTLTMFISRLHWQSHFIQKLECQYQMEFKNLNSEFDVIRMKANPEIIEAFFAGKTGIPYIDATMRQLQTIGRCNFRSRALIVSYICNTCMQPWFAIAKRLGALFCDYEPGIHYPQIQMQAGTTGINIIRIYNPIKNGRERDPKGEWIKLWLPELSGVPEKYIHEPWKWEGSETLKYPLPIVDIEISNRIARDLLWGVKKGLNREETQKIYEKHGSRNFRRKKTPKKQQQVLTFDI